jgi:hypothetical protein
LLAGVLPLHQTGCCPPGELNPLTRLM